MLPSIASSFLLVFLTLPLANLAARPHGSFGRRHPDRNPYHSRHNHPPYTLEVCYKGDDFLDPAHWDFFSAPDPTHGRVNYQTRGDAVNKKLAYVREDGATVLAVDDTNHVPLGSNRDSVRISSTRTFNGGLFIADFQQMPHGCSVWPAWWSVGPGWPNGGEIDVLEGVHDQRTNQYTLHTSFEPGCNLPTTFVDTKMSPRGRALHPQCGVSGADNTGCAFSDTETNSYGRGFNDAGGGVYVHLWDPTGIYMWHFPRCEIPEDILQKKPDPTNWRPPMASFTRNTCDIDAHFRDHVLVLDTTLCGDWAGATYADAGCPGTCDQAVTDPGNYHNAKWVINEITVYQPTSQSPPPP